MYMFVESISKIINLMQYLCFYFFLFFLFFCGIPRFTIDTIHIQRTVGSGSHSRSLTPLYIRLCVDLYDDNPIFLEPFPLS